ncbi:hypothetical protein FXO38_04772 [Capsicum annuum]|uniref:Uncharacterized protein n=1 Tax=Capsicum annuum TaxID=4072 RepID=A0A2G3AGV9_CAPAN|nr:hypothetical protein FXO38_04772 [Capsicum annuum]KAF3678247.1 hypothetical protein FXO37_04469 [Capsicum annuum]PHT93403.1 hypothetical protein T459_01285 [Capsicum annuum]
MPKERIEKFSTKLSSSEGNIQMKMDEEHLIFCYFARENRKDGQLFLEVCTQQSHPLRREMSHKAFQDLKKIMTVPVIQVPSITLELLGSNNLAHKIKGKLKDDVTSEKIYGLTEKGKETTLSHYTSVGKNKESEDEKMPQQTSVFERIGRLTPHVSIFEKLGCKDKNRSSNQMEREDDTSRTSFFYHFGTTKNSLAQKGLLENKKQGFLEGIDDKDIHSIFPSRMKRKVVLSITTDGSVKVKRSTIVLTNQFCGETKNEKEEAIMTSEGSQLEDSNFLQASYHITVEEGPYFDGVDDDVQEDPPQ